MNNQDSFSRIVTYFKALASEDFVWNNQIIKHYDCLKLSPLAFRSYSCPSHCGACCMKCSLVWDEKVIDSSIPITYTINNTEKTFYVDFQKEHNESKCRHLNLTDGLCKLYLKRPLPCRLELFKFIHYTSKNEAHARVQLPGRRWALTRVDGEQGGICEIRNYDPKLTQSHIYDLKILQQWMSEFKITNRCDVVIEYLSSGPHNHVLTIGENQ